jgi:peptidoglycan/LPS O-acetylase OafA/YrhL
MLNNPDAPKPPISTMHLWFLYYLIWFYALILLFLFIYRRLNLKTIDWFNTIAKRPIVFLLLLPLVLVPSMLSQFSPLPAPEQLNPALWAFGFHGVFFVLGWLIYKQPPLLALIQPFMWPMLLIGLVFYTIYYSFMPSTFTMMDAMHNLTNSPEIDLAQVIKAIAEAYLSMYTVLAVLLIGKRFFDRQNKVAQFVSRSSYWVYIIHLPLVWILQFILLDTELPMLIEFAISAFGTIAIGMLTYVVFVSWSPIGWLLNGRQKSKSIEKSALSEQ